MTELESFYFGWGLYNIIIISLLYLYFINHKSGRITLFVCVIAFIILALYGSIIGPDYWPYNRIVENVSLYGINTKNTHLEDIYLYILPYLGNNYMSFQILIYVSSFVMLYYVYSRYQAKYNYNITAGLLFFSILGLYLSLVSRQFLSTMCICVFIVLYHDKKYLVSLIFLILAVLFHKSSYILVPLLFLSMMFDLNKKKVILMLCVLPILIVVGYSLVRYLQNYIFSVADMNKNGAVYMIAGDSAKAGSIWWTIVEVVQFIVNMLLSFWVLHKMANMKLYGIHLFLYKYLFWITYVALLFYFLPLENKSISTRVMYMYPVIVSLLIPFIIQKTKQYKRAIIYVLLLLFLFLTNVYIRGVANGNLYYKL